MENNKNPRPTVTAPVKRFSFGVERQFTATDDLATVKRDASGIIVIEEGHCY